MLEAFLGKSEKKILAFPSLEFLALGKWRGGEGELSYFANGCAKLSRRLARYHRTIALLQSPLAERSVTVSVSLRSPAVNLVA
jgi:hypothetical protein